MLEAALILLAAVFTAATAAALGLLLFRFLRVALDRSEAPWIAFITGSAVLSMLVFAIAISGLAYASVFASIGVASIAAAYALRVPLLPSPVQLTFVWRATLGLIGIVYAAVYLANSVAPEASPDGSAYHLGLVRRYFEAHRMM